MKSFTFELDCHGQKVLAEIDEHMNLTLHGYDEEYEKSLMEFGESGSACADAIEYWNWGWYFKVISEYIFDHMDYKKVALLLAKFAEHIVDQREHYLFRMVIMYTRNFAEQKHFDVGFGILDSYNSGLGKLGWQSFAAQDKVETNISDALINLLAWIRLQGPKTEEDQGYIHSFAGFLAEAAGHIHQDKFEEYKLKEQAWQIHQFLEFMQTP